MVRYCALITLLTLFLIPKDGWSQSGYKLKKVVLDAGHGGNQPGAVVGKYKEKDITLSVTKLLGEMIQSHYPEVQVIYTRTSDVAVDLYKRGEIANNAQADLFISIHVNASKSTSASGTETFVMGANKSQQNLDVAMAENSVISYEQDHQAKYEGFDPSSAESYIIFSLMQYSYLEQSLAYAAALQSEYTSATPMQNRGVKQAGFLVLWNTAMPSVLTEIGFLSNAQDRAFLTSSSGQTTIAKSLFNAFTKYKAEAEGSSASKSEPIEEQPREKREKKIDEEPRGEEINREDNIDIFFSVQVKSSTSKVTINNRTFGAFTSKIWYKKVDGRYKYFVEKVNSYKEALSLQNSVRQGGIKDAFVVAYAGEQQMAVAEAKRLTEAAR